MEEATTEVIEQVSDPAFMNWFVDLFYYPDNLVKTVLAVFGLLFVLIFFLECIYILKQGVNSAK